MKNGNGDYVARPYTTGTRNSIINTRIRRNFRRRAGRRNARAAYACIPVRRTHGSDGDGISERGEREFESRDKRAERERGRGGEGRGQTKKSKTLT